MTIERKQKYIGIKLNGMSHWLWFETKETYSEGGNFVGSNGWGKNGSLTNIVVKEHEINGVIYSDTFSTHN